ncbi:MAG TPA: hypothetical protein VGP24_02705 [Glaciihabitans sp.]|jgi:hypothetical protein|nr:hypothetical protein [Glaciihabitans sp.]
MASNHTHGDADGVYVPSPPDTRTYIELGSFAVDGETFSVRMSPDDGAIHYDWITGPNEGYGFDSFGSSQPHEYEEYVASIRDFLARVDPATGYLANP